MSKALSRRGEASALGLCGAEAHAEIGAFRRRALAGPFRIT